MDFFKKAAPKNKASEGKDPVNKAGMFSGGATGLKIKPLPNESADKPGDKPAKTADKVVPKDSAGSTSTPKGKLFGEIEIDKVEDQSKKGKSEAKPDKILAGVKRNKEAAPPEGNVFTKLFNEKKETNPAPKMEGDTKIIDRIVKQTTSDKKMVLGDKPVTRSALLGPEYAAMRKLRTVKLVVQLVVFLAILGVGFFYSQLKPDFVWFEEVLGPNPVQKLAAFETETKGVKTEINYYNFLVAKFELDKFLQAADHYNTVKNKLLRDDLTMEEMERFLAEKEATFQAIKASLAIAQDKIKRPLETKGLPMDLQRSSTELQSEYKDDLKAFFQGQKGTFADFEAEEAAKEVKILEGSVALLLNRQLQIEINKIDVENLTDPDIDNFVSKINETSRNNFAVVAEIKKNRLNWRKVLQDITEITKELDPLYGIEEISMIVYNSFSVGIASQQVSLSGEMRTLDSSNFDKYIKLIDKFNQSGKFKIAEQRSFSKQKQDEWYVTGLSLSLDLIPEELSKESDVSAL